MATLQIASNTFTTKGFFWAGAKGPLARTRQVHRRIRRFCSVRIGEGKPRWAPLWQTGVYGRVRRRRSTAFTLDKTSGPILRRRNPLP